MADDREIAAFCESRYPPNPKRHYLFLGDATCIGRWWGGPNLHPVPIQKGDTTAYLPWVTTLEEALEF